jgi:hypothetical protein
MSIAGWIREKKNKVNSVVEARQEAVREDNKRRLQLLETKNAVLRADLTQEENLRKAKAEQRQLRMTRLKNKLPNFGGGSPGSGGKVTVGFRKPVKSGLIHDFGGNSPFSAKNLAKDSFGKDKTMTGTKLGGGSPFSNVFASGNSSGTKRKKKSKGKNTTIIIRGGNT